MAACSSSTWTCLSNGATRSEARTQYARQPFLACSSRGHHPCSRTPINSASSCARHVCDTCSATGNQSRLHLPCRMRDVECITSLSLRSSVFFKKPSKGLSEQKSGGGGGRRKSGAMTCTAEMQQQEATVDQRSSSSSSVPTTQDDILIIGPGVLGSLIGQLWRTKFPDSRVVGQTRTTSSHERLRSIGIEPVTKDGDANDAAEEAKKKYPNVVFCAPPYGNDDYGGELRAAALRWDGEGSLLFTSSSAVYGVEDGGVCDEDAPIIPKGVSPRVDRLLAAEEEVLKVGGNVVRLAGLYTLDRGAHAYWMNKGQLDLRPDHILNLISYEDASELCVLIMAMADKIRGRIFMGCDGTPVTRQEVMDCVIRSERLEGEFGGFVGKEGIMGKQMKNDHTKTALDWKPKYPSLANFLATVKK